MGTGVGSMPGTNFTESMKIALDQDLAFVPELPGRGPGADMIGRAATLLVDMPVETAAGAWRLSTKPGADARRTADLAERDLDELTEIAQDFVGPLKVQIAGPWTLAAQLELPGGRNVLADAGAVHDVAASLCEGIANYLNELVRRVPGAIPVVQLDEPLLPAVVRGALPVMRGLATYPAVGVERATGLLRTVISALSDVSGKDSDEIRRFVAVHICASRAPVKILADAGADAISLDFSLLDSREFEALGEAVEGGTALWHGVVGSTDSKAGGVFHIDAVQPRSNPKPSDPTRTVSYIESFYSRLGFSSIPAARVPIAITPTCGLVGASSEYAATALSMCHDIARRLTEKQEG